jgi:hypothetical protein
MVAMGTIRKTLWGKMDEPYIREKKDRLRQNRISMFLSFLLGEISGNDRGFAGRCGNAAALHFGPRTLLAGCH